MTRIAIAVVAALLAAGCAVRVPAPVDDRRPATAPPPSQPPVAQPAPPPAPSPVPAIPPGSVYTVRAGDTLYSIAAQFGLDSRELARWNQIDDITRMRVGQVLRLTPPSAEPAVQIGTAPGTAPLEARPLDGRPQEPRPGEPPAQPSVRTDVATKTGPKALRLPYSEENVALLARGQTTSPAPVAGAAPTPAPQVAAVAPRPEAAKPAAERDPDAIDFVWPVKGRVLAAFSEPNSKGVDIGGKIGEPVLAAAQGRVMYTGTGIRGYGKLIVIKHDNGFNSVYAHNREILVKEGQTVARGQKIAELGDSESDRPKLHFEIRKSGKPVDPMRYLPPPS
jgi:lipoprotein NlpD